jgi:hypothetical protein
MLSSEKEAAHPEPSMHFKLKLLVSILLAQLIYFVLPISISAYLLAQLKQK